MANHSFRWISWMKICAFREEFPFKKYSGSWIMTLCYCLTLGVPGRRIRLVCEKKVNHLDVPLHRSHVKPGQQKCWIVYTKTSPAKYRRFYSGLDVLHFDLHSLNWQDTINNSCRLLSYRNQKGVNQLISSWTKWPPFCRCHFQIHFYEWKVLYFDILIFVPKEPIDNDTELVKVMVWRRTGDKPLPEPMLTQLTDACMWH